MSSVALEARDIVKEFAGFAALDGLTLAVADGARFMR